MCNMCIYNAMFVIYMYIHNAIYVICVYIHTICNMLWHHHLPSDKLNQHRLSNALYDKQGYQTNKLDVPHAEQHVCCHGDWVRAWQT